MSKNVIRRIEEKRYLFRDMEHYYRSEFSDEEQGHLDSFKEKMDNIEDIKEAQRYLDALSEIYEILNVSRFRLSPDTSISSAFHADLAGLNEGRTKVCDELLPIEGGVQTSSYARLMGWMSVVIGELAEKSNDYSSLYSKEDAKNDDIMNLSSSSTLLAEDSDRGKLNLERVDDDDDDYNNDDNNDDDEEEEELIII